MKRTLIYGYGNPGRNDDGLGVKLAEMVRDWATVHAPGLIDTDINYQLNIEDAETISKYDRVIFADASTEDFVCFRYTGVNPDDARVEFTMHAVSPAYILHLCHNLFGKFPETRLLHIKGYRWDFKEGFSDNAALNLDCAYQFIINIFKKELNGHHQFQTA